MKISACIMFCNDDFYMLKRCISSIRGIVDHIACVYNGPERIGLYERLAIDYGADEVHFHDWVDFSTNRNKSLEYAKHELILCIDPDEELIIDKEIFKHVKKNKKKTIKKKIIKFVMKNKDIDAFSIAVRNIRNDTKTTFSLGTRLFWADRGFEFQSTVHNQLVKRGGDFNVLGEAIPFLKLDHFGYNLPPDIQKKKDVRRVENLKRKLAIFPDDMMTCFYLVHALTFTNELEDAIYYGEKVINLMNKQDPIQMQFAGSIYHTMFRLTGLKLREQEAQGIEGIDYNYPIKYLTEGIKYFPQDLDLRFDAASVMFFSENSEAFFIHAMQYLTAYRAMKNNPGIFGYRFVYTFNEECRKKMVKMIESKNMELKKAA